MLDRVIAFGHDRRIVWEPTPGDAVASRNAKLPTGAAHDGSWAHSSYLTATTTIVTEIFDCTEAAQSIGDDVRDGQGCVLGAGCRLIVL